MRDRERERERGRQRERDALNIEHLGTSSQHKNMSLHIHTSAVANYIATAQLMSSILEMVRN